MKISRNSQGVYYWTDYIQGKRVKRESKTWKYKYQAQADYDEFILAHGDLQAINLTFEQLVNKFLAFSELKNKLSHVNKSRYDLDRYAKTLYPLIVDKITNEQMNDWQRWLLKTTTRKGEPLKNRYLQSIQSLVKRVFKFGIDHKFTNNNPTLTMIIIQRKELHHVQEKRILTTQEFNEFIERIDGLEYKAFFSTLYWCGLRMGEAIALNMGDYKSGRLLVSKNYDYTNHVLTTTKTNKSRYVDVPKRCGLLLDELLQYNQQFDNDGDSPLFGVYKRLSPTSIRRKRDEALGDLEPFKIHDLRHSHVSTLIELGFTAFEISKRLGHSVEMVNNTYGHLFPSKQKAMIDKLNEL